MASYPSSSIFLLALLLFASGGILGINGQMLGANITGRIACSPNPNSRTGPGLAGAVVTVVCSRSNTIFGQAITNVTGGFLVVGTTTIHVLPLLKCTAVANISTSNCTALPTNSLLGSPLIVLGKSVQPSGLVTFILSARLFRLLF